MLATDHPNPGPDAGEIGTAGTLYVEATQLGEIPDWGPTYEWVTPEKAAEVLKNSAEDEDFQNRKLVPAEVKKLARYMRTNRFKHFLVTEPIAYDEKGVLINGKTRYNAVVEAGVTCGFIVFRGVPRDHFEYSGVARPKKVDHVLHGYKKMAQPQVVAALKFMLRYEEFLAGIRGPYGWRHWHLESAKTDQPADLNAVYDRREEVVDNYGNAMKVRKGCKLLPVSLMVFMTYQWYAWPEGADKLDTFLDSLTFGSNLEKGSAALSLYNFGRHEYCPNEGKQAAHLILLFRHFGAFAKKEKLPTAVVAFGNAMLTPFHPKGPDEAIRNLREGMVPINAPAEALG